MSSLPPLAEMSAPALPVRVVGDVHLCLEEMEVMDHFLAWLTTLEGTGGTLILLGDVFDLWVGKPQQHDPLPRHVLACLARLQQAGTTLAFMAGNRDLVFRGVDSVEMQILPDPVRTTIDGKAVLLTHGDQLCTADRGYQAMRRFFYGPGGTALDKCLPFPIQRWLGEGVRTLSRRATGKKTTSTMDIDYGEALRWMEAFDVEVMVAGHVHTGLRHSHPGPPAREIIVLKDWERGGSVITFEDGTISHAAP